MLLNLIIVRLQKFTKDIYITNTYLLIHIFYVQLI